MNRRDFLNSVRRGKNIIEETGFLRTVSSIDSLPVTEQYRRIALDPSATYEKIYLAGLELVQYNFVMNDYSYFQFSLLKEDPTEVRLAFFPNPYSDFTESYTPELEEALEDGVYSFEEYAQVLAEENPRHDVPALRFEVNAGQYKELDHPYAHLHLGRHEDNRWPVARILTPYMFTLLIIKQFYRYKLADCRRVPGPGGSEISQYDVDIINEVANCRAVSPELFTATERRQPHLA